MNRYNQKVFITPPWKEIYSTDNERDQTAEEAIEVYNKIFIWYREHEYDPLILPMDTIENRANFILDHVT